MRVVDKTEKFSRRSVLKASGATSFGIAVIGAGGVVSLPGQAWAMTAKALKPETMATLLQMARDIYPHDRIRDSYYATAIAGHDAKAATDDAHKTLIESGVAGLDLAAQGHGAKSYVGVGWEVDRVAILRSIESTPFFQAVRGGLVTGLYNNKELWPLFGYEGASASKGGYIKRGFDDIDWL